MVAIHGNSTLEVWSAQYINERSEREPNDREARILQIEECIAVPGDYLVEVLRDD